MNNGLAIIGVALAAAGASMIQFARPSRGKPGWFKEPTVLGEMYVTASVAAFVMGSTAIGAAAHGH
ncbi:MAG: hypothetical protein OJF62_000230 [Pseudolabrys sp.]|jgi:hypothetical protein|nr:hypothetical protein [Pseudolabrys sp.]